MELAGFKALGGHYCLAYATFWIPAFARMMGLLNNRQHQLPVSSPVFSAINEWMIDKEDYLNRLNLNFSARTPFDKAWF